MYSNLYNFLKVHNNCNDNINNELFNNIILIGSYHKLFSINILYDNKHNGNVIIKLNLKKLVINPPALGSSNVKPNIIRAKKLIIK